MKSLIGQRFGLLTVLEYCHQKGKHAIWKCQCDCGKKTFVSGSNLTCNRTSSCGHARKSGWGVKTGTQRQERDTYGTDIDEALEDLGAYG